MPGPAYLQQTSVLSTAALGKLCLQPCNPAGAGDRPADSQTAWRRRAGAVSVACCAAASCLRSCSREPCTVPAVPCLPCCQAAGGLRAVLSQVLPSARPTLQASARFCCLSGEKISLHRPVLLSCRTVSAGILPLSCGAIVAQPPESAFLPGFLVHYRKCGSLSKGR